mgnify:CR=1 FL=1
MFGPERDRAFKAYFHKDYRETPELLKDNCFKELDGEHGRINERVYRCLPITTWLDETEKFKDSFVVIEVKRTRHLKNKREKETSYYITSLKGGVSILAGYVLRHWSIENSQHWVLDVTFRED